MLLIPLELFKSNRDSVRKAREAYLIDRGQTIEPLGLNTVRVKDGISLRNGMWNDVRNGIIMQNTSCGMT